MNEELFSDFNKRLLEVLNKCQYPNLMAVHRYKLHLWSLAAGARVSEDIMKAVLNNEEDLSGSEKRSLANYSFVKTDCLFSPKLSVLDKHKVRHKIWMRELNDMLYRIWDASKEGNQKAINFMKGNLRTAYVNLDLDFRNNELVPYAKYLSVRERMEMAIHDVFGYGEDLIRTKKIGKFQSTNLGCAQV